MPTWLKLRQENGGWCVWQCVRMADIFTTLGAKHFWFPYAGRRGGRLSVQAAGESISPIPRLTYPNTPGLRFRLATISIIQRWHFTGISYARPAMNFIT